MDKIYEKYDFITKASHQKEILKSRATNKSFVSIKND